MAPRARGRAQSARVSESEGCTTQADCRPSVSGQSDARTHIGMASTRPTFVHLETVRGLHARGRAHSARASDSNGVVCKVRGAITFGAMTGDSGQTCPCTGAPFSDLADAQCSEACGTFCGIKNHGQVWRL